jgi:hypothetical protein
MYYKLAILSALTIFVLNSCSKNHQSGLALHNVQPDASGDTITYVKNSSNPYDSIGQVHDNGLRAEMPNYMGSPLLEPTQANAFSFTNSYLVSQGFSGPFLTILDDTIKNRYDSSLFTMSLSSLNTYLLSKGLISTRAFGYLEGLNTTLTNFKNDSATSGAYDSLCQSITTLEDSVLANSTFMASGTDPIVVLSATSTARYSAGYWMNFHNSSPSIDGTVTTLGWFSWAKVWGGDVVGAIAGGVGGAAAGSLAGGVGAGPGALAGAVGGGISNSLYEAGMQIWNKFF